jgi:hypothetical protein
MDIDRKPCAIGIEKSASTSSIGCGDLMSPSPSSTLVGLTNSASAAAASYFNSSPSSASTWSQLQHPASASYMEKSRAVGPLTVSSDTYYSNPDDFKSRLQAFGYRFPAVAAAIGQMHNATYDCFDTAANEEKSPFITGCMTSQFASIPGRTSHYSAECKLPLIRIDLNHFPTFDFSRIFRERALIVLNVVMRTIGL